MFLILWACRVTPASSFYAPLLITSNSVWLGLYIPEIYSWVYSMFFFFFFLWTRCTWRVKVLNAYVIVHLWLETRLCPNASTRTAEGLVWHELVFLPWMLRRGWVTVEANSSAGTGVGDGTAAGASGQQLPCSKCNINRANRLYR